MKRLGASLFVIFISLIITACSDSSVFRGREAAAITSKLIDFKPSYTRYIVRFQADSHPDLNKSLLPEHHLIGARLSLELEDIGLLDLQKVTPDLRAEVLRELGKRREIRYIEPDGLHQVESSSSVYALQEFNKQWSHSVIQSNEAWLLASEGQEITVAVIDGGVDIHHPDLVDNIWRNPRETLNGKNDDPHFNDLVDDIHGWDFAKDDNDPRAEEVIDSHGTHVAGIIAAVNGNGTGVAGHGINVRVMPLRYLVSGTGYTINSVKAIRYAINNGARVINASWGGDTKKTILMEALKEAENAGVLVVAAAGNQGRDADKKPYYPASYPYSNIISVTATGKEDQLWSGSNFGRQNVHIAAPGMAIYSTVNQGHPAKSRNGKEIKVDYLAKWGTSMATPVVSGVAAMILSVRPELGPEQVREILVQSADRVGTLDGKVLAGGRINAFQALQLAKTYPEAGANSVELASGL